MSIGSGPGSIGRVIVSGVNGRQRATIRSNLAVANYGTGSLVIENGALCDTPQLHVGNAFGSAGDVTVGKVAGGFNAELVMNGPLRLGDNNIGEPSSPYTGSVTVNSGGVLHGATLATVGNGYTGTGTLSVNGGEFSANDLRIVRGDVNLSDGTLNAPMQHVGSNIFNSVAAATFTQTGGLNRAGVAANGTPLRATLTVDGDANTPAAYNLYGGRLLADVTNKDHVTQTGGTLDGAVTNIGTFTIGGAPAATTAAAPNDLSAPLVTGAFSNRGTVHVAGGAARFAADFTNDSRFVSDGGRSHFTSFRTGINGVVAAAAGAEFDVTGEFRNDSTRSADWDTSGAVLHFSGSGESTGAVNWLWVNGADKGATGGGYDDNFAWGTLHLDAGEPLTLQSASTGHAFYVRELLLDGGAAQIRAVRGASTGANLYYDATAPANAYLLGQRYDLNGGGAIIPVVPEPTAAGVLLLPAAWALRRRRGAWHGRPARVLNSNGAGAGNACSAHLCTIHRVRAGV
jgi:T5SS/PEP-CTERM-associated repeat protein